MPRFRVRLFPTLLALATAGAVWVYLTSTEDAPGDWPLTIDSADDTHRFTVELALTQDKRIQGLMYRENLADDAGMLFAYDRPDVQTMWMKNTPLSLDMLFIDPDGIIRRIVRDTVPFSSTTIIGPPGILYVLELRAGVTRRLGIKAGHQVRNLPLPDQLPASSVR